MPNILITGSKGFIGKNLYVALQRHASVDISTFNSDNSIDELDAMAKNADLVFHLAGVNRPDDSYDFVRINIRLTAQLCDILANSDKIIPLVFSSSTQAEQNNAYGQSKHQAEDIVADYSIRTGAPVYIIRLPNVFGKWCRPNYNSVVATLCHNLSRDLPVSITNRDAPITFIYIDDVIKMFIDIMQRDKHTSDRLFYDVENTFQITLGHLYDMIKEIKHSRCCSLLPDMNDPFLKYLYSTYASHLELRKLACPAELRVDNRGWLFEFVKSFGCGQIFVSMTQPGVTRGNHYHDSKVEKFCVILGEAIIRLRSVLDGEVYEYRVDGNDIQIVDIPPGYTHSIENIGGTDMITLFWANEVYDVSHSDTWDEDVMATILK